MHSNNYPSAYYLSKDRMQIQNVHKVEANAADYMHRNHILRYAHDIHKNHLHRPHLI